MLVFVNLDCMLPAGPDAASPDEGLGVSAFESVLDAWPQLRVVITSELRYRMTIEQLRAIFSARCRQRVIATSLLYGALAQGATLTREQEILDWLRHADAPHADWLALDKPGVEFQLHADRLVACARFDRPALARLHAHLLQRAMRQEAVVSVDVDVGADAQGLAFGVLTQPAGTLDLVL